MILCLHEEKNRSGNAGNPGETKAQKNRPRFNESGFYAIDLLLIFLNYS
jgi:hypothetical protein